MTPWSTVVSMGVGVVTAVCAVLAVLYTGTHGKF
jgi:hypothetical protein